MNVYQGGNNVFVDVGEVVYWLKFPVEQVAMLNPFNKIKTGPVLDTRISSKSGKTIIQLAEGTSHIFSMSKSSDRRGYDDFIKTRDAFVEKDGGSVSKLRKYSAFHDLGEDSVEVHVYHAETPRQYNNRPNLMCERSEFIDWCL